MKRLILLLSSLLFIASCSQKSPQKQPKTENIFYDKAFKFRDTLKVYDSAFFYFDIAKNVFSEKKDSLGVGKSLLNMAIISTEKDDYLGGQELSLNAMSYFNEKDETQHVFIRSNFNNLGIASYRLGEYKNALKFYDLAIKFSKNSSDSLAYLGNKATVYRELKDYESALKIYGEILNKTHIFPEQYATVETNIATTKWLQDSNYNAAPELIEALNIREKENNILGRNSSYAHLADFYEKKQPDSALFYANKMYLMAKAANSPDNQSHALEKLIRLNPSKAIKYFNIYQPLKDSLETARNNDKNQLAPIRYEIEKHRADNLKLQKENTEKTYVVITLVILLGAGTFWYRKRKQRLEMEKENAIRESRLKTSKKVHDVVANGLYRVMNKIEYQPEIDKEVLLDEIEDLYEKSRDISYEKPLAPTAHFHQKIASLAHSFHTDQVHVHLIGNTATLWNEVKLTAQDEVIHILQELLVNMRKHSQASEVTLQFAKQDNVLYITYDDNGIGIKGELKSNNGLRNTETRIKNLQGQITFETGSEKGLSINFSFPVSSKT